MEISRLPLQVLVILFPEISTLPHVPATMHRTTPWRDSAGRCRTSCWFARRRLSCQSLALTWPCCWGLRNPRSIQLAKRESFTKVQHLAHSGLVVVCRDLSSSEWSAFSLRQARKPPHNKNTLRYGISSFHSNSLFKLCFYHCCTTKAPPALTNSKNLDVSDSDDIGFPELRLVFGDDSPGKDSFLFPSSGILIGNELRVWRPKVIQVSKLGNLKIAPSIICYWWRHLSGQCVDNVWHKGVCSERMVAVTNRRYRLRDLLLANSPCTRGSPDMRSPEVSWSIPSYVVPC